MLKSCKYCGRIHESAYICPPKKQAEAIRQKHRGDTMARAFRKSTRWTNKSIAIRERDHYMCLCCKAKLVGTVNEINTINLSVHHIVPIEEDFELKLDESNLITVCGKHHEMCEANEISRDEQRRLVGQSMKERDEEGSTYGVLCV